MLVSALPFRLHGDPVRLSPRASLGSQSQEWWHCSWSTKGTSKSNV